MKSGLTLTIFLWAAPALLGSTANGDNQKIQCDPMARDQMSGFLDMPPSQPAIVKMERLEEALRFLNNIQFPSSNQVTTILTKIKSDTDAYFPDFMTSVQSNSCNHIYLKITEGLLELSRQKTTAPEIGKRIQIAVLESLLKPKFPTLLASAIDTRILSMTLQASLDVVPETLRHEVSQLHQNMRTKIKDWQFRYNRVWTRVEARAPADIVKSREWKTLKPAVQQEAQTAEGVFQQTQHLAYQLLTQLKE